MCTKKTTLKFLEAVGKLHVCVGGSRSRVHPSGFLLLGGQSQKTKTTRPCTENKTRACWLGAGSTGNPPLCCLSRATAEPAAFLAGTLPPCLTRGQDVPNAG